MDESSLDPALRMQQSSPDWPDSQSQSQPQLNSPIQLDLGSQSIDSRSTPTTPEPSSLSKRVSWSDTMTEKMLKVLLATNGQAQNGFKDAMWNEVVSAVQGVARRGIMVTKPACKSRYTALKTDWRMWTAIVRLSGWSIDEDGLPTADEKSMNEYFDKHKLAAKFRTKLLKWQPELDQLFTVSVAAGENAVGGIIGLQQQEGFDLTTETEASDSYSTTAGRKRVVTELAKEVRKKQKAAQPVSDIKSLIEAIREVGIMMRPVEKESPIEKATKVLFLSGGQFEGLDRRTKMDVIQWMNKRHSLEIFIAMPVDMQVEEVNEVVETMKLLDEE